MNGVAERALLARERDDGRYDLSAAQWGGTNRALAAVFDGTSPVDVTGIAWHSLDRTVGFSTLVDGLDYLMTEVLYRVRTSETTVFLPLWFGLPVPDARPSPTSGAVVAVTSLRDANLVRVRFRTLKGALADAIAGGTLPVTAAPFVLRGAIAACEDREFHVASPRPSTEPLSGNGRPDGL